LRRKPSILNTRLIFFLQHKKISDLKINMPENHKSLSLSFILFFFKRRKKKKTACSARSLAQASDPVGHKKKGRSLLNEQGKMHAKRPR